MVHKEDQSLTGRDQLRFLRARKFNVQLAKQMYVGGPRITFMELTTAGSPTAKNGGKTLAEASTS